MRNWLNKHDVITKLLSIFAAVILWSYFVSVQNPTRTLEYRDIAVTLTGVDELYNSYNLKVVEGADATVNVRVSASTSRLATLTASQIKVQANVGDTISAPGTYDITYNVLLPETGMTCVNRSPSTISVTVDEVETKTVPVSVELTSHAPKGYVFDTPELSAANVEISGPVTILNQVSKAVISIDSDGLKETLTNNYSYKLVNARGELVDATNVSRSVASVTVKIPVKQVKSVPLTVTISPENAEDTVSMAISPKTVEIIGDPAAVNNVKAIHLGAINVNNIENGDTFEYDISLPSGVSLSDGQPTSASVTIRLAEDITRDLEITNIQMKDVNPDQDASVTMETSSLTVTLVGAEKKLKEITAEDITAVAELSSADLSNGLHTIGVTVNSPDGITVSGNYSATIRITREEDTTGEDPIREDS